LSIGVSGHRLPPKLPTESVAPLRALLDGLLAAIRDAARSAETDAAAWPDRGAGDFDATRFARNVVIVSSLAEGADRLVAQAGIAAGFGLEVVLPLARAEYARDFTTQESRAEFEYLFGRAAAIVELDASADQRPRAYEAAGLFMLSRIDLLIAVWDGLAAAGVGGTADIVRRAMAGGIGVVWIEPAPPHAIRLSGGAAGLPPADTLPALECFRSTDVAAVAEVAKQIMTLPARPSQNNLATK
jgi:hypothetical protein